MGKFSRGRKGRIRRGRTSRRGKELERSY